MNIQLKDLLKIVDGVDVYAPKYIGYFFSGQVPEHLERYLSYEVDWLQAPESVQDPIIECYLTEFFDVDMIDF